MHLWMADAVSIRRLFAWRVRLYHDDELCLMRPLYEGLCQFEYGLAALFYPLCLHTCVWYVRHGYHEEDTHDRCASFLHE
jgi:hypothetical protein